MCDNTHCKGDAASLYLGQAPSFSISEPVHRNNDESSYPPSWPSGWSSIRSNWDGMCVYTGYGNSAMCSVPGLHTNPVRFPQPHILIMPNVRVLLLLECLSPKIKYARVVTVVRGLNRD